jgi:hypothetical protein
MEYKRDFHKRMFEVFDRQPGIGLLGAWRHTAHGLFKGGVRNHWFTEMDDVPGVGWMMPKAAMEKVGMFPEHGPCLTKGGNGEDSAYVVWMREKGFLVGLPTEAVDSDVLAKHIDGY